MQNSVDPMAPKPSVHARFVPTRRGLEDCTRGGILPPSEGSGEIGPLLRRATWSVENLCNIDGFVKSPHSRHSREGGSPEVREFPGFPFSREGRSEKIGQKIGVKPLILPINNKAPLGSAIRFAGHGDPKNRKLMGKPHMKVKCKDAAPLTTGGGHFHSMSLPHLLE